VAAAAAGPAWASKVRPTAITADAVSTATRDTRTINVLRKKGFHEKLLNRHANRENVMRAKARITPMPSETSAAARGWRTLGVR
jgi:hypothetical protein